MPLPAVEQGAVPLPGVNRGLCRYLLLSRVGSAAAWVEGKGAALLRVLDPLGDAVACNFRVTGTQGFKRRAYIYKIAGRGGELESVRLSGNICSMYRQTS